MAKVNKRPFHCIAAGTHNSHLTLSSKVIKWRIGWISSPGLVHQTGPSHAGRDTERAFHPEISEGLHLVPAPSPLLHIFSPPFPPDVTGGFSVSQREEPREGGDLHLTCVANKYLYTALSWQRVNDTEDAQTSSPAMSSQQLTSGEFSNRLVLLLSNLTARDSGAYRCSTRHLITGQEAQLDTQVVVTSE